MDILIDYLSFTDKNSDIQYWIDKLNLSDVVFDSGSSKASYGWNTYYYYHGLHLRFGGREDIGIEMSGTGCRFLEEVHKSKNKHLSWVDFLIELFDDPHCNISRLDVACDDKEGFLSMDLLYSHVWERKYISRARRCVWMGGSEENIVFGSSKSDTRLRFYNKALEREIADEHWIRAEFQFRDKAADSFISNLKLHDNDIGLTYSGVLINYLRFTDRPPDANNNNSRIPTAYWWLNFTNDAKRIKNVLVGGLEYNYEDLLSYIKNQCSSSLLTYALLNGYDDLFGIISGAKLNDRQKSLLNNSGVFVR